MESKTPKQVNKVLESVWGENYLTEADRLVKMTIISRLTQPNFMEWLASEVDLKEQLDHEGIEWLSKSFNRLVIVGEMVD